jgi:hypothetical protein
VAVVGNADRVASHDQTCLLGFSAPANAGARTVRAPACRSEAPVRLETPVPARGPVSATLPTPHQPRAPPAALA